MKIPGFISDYSRMVNNDAARAELKELAKEYVHQLNAIKKSVQGTATMPANKVELCNSLLQTCMARARNIARNSIDDKAAFEEIVWKHKIAYTKPVVRAATKR